MKLTFYLDAISGALAFTRPVMPKPEGIPRYKFTIELPDPVLYDVDLGEVKVEPQP